MTFEQYKAKSLALSERAAAYERMVSDRAKTEFDKAFGKSEHYICFHYAHNWKGQSWLTPQQNKACRLVGYLDSKRWSASRITDKIISRMWREYAKQAA